MTQPGIRAAMNPSLTGICLVIAGGFIFSIQDVIIKYVSGSYPVHEILFFRSLFGLLPILFIVRMEGGFHLLKVHNSGYHIIRCIIMFSNYTIYYLAISAIPLSLAVTLFFCCPLFITILSVLFLDETIDIKGWTALFTGFSGVMLIMGPDLSNGQEAFSSFHYGHILALVSGFLYAVNAVMTRKFGIRESGSSLVCYPVLTYILGASLLWMILGDGRFKTGLSNPPAFLIRGWVLPRLPDLFLFFILGFVASAGTYCLSQAYRISDASVVAPFEYFAIPISVAWGYLFWNEIPGFLPTTGILMIIGAGVAVMKRKKRNTFK